MKKAILGAFALMVLGLAMTSCGPKLMTEAEVQAAIEKGFTEGRAAVEQEMTAKCDAEFEQRVTAELERMKAEAAVPVQ
ncbi:MAG: hypothetical protein SFV52_08870 [Saprospiraceae bacterium]|nr:hypothetical protein [Saprospiraceae bacterium]